MKNFKNFKHKNLTRVFFSLLIIGTIAISNTSAQFLSFGPRIGLSSSKVQVEENFNYNGEEISYKTDDAKIGFQVGAFARVKVKSFYVQPEILFTSSGGKISVSSETAGEEIRNLNYNKIDAPVMVGYEIWNFLRVQAGPSFSLLLSDNVKNTNAFEEAKQNYNDATVGYQVGLGFDIKQVYVDFKYEGNLSKFGNSVSFGDQEFDADLRTQMFILVVGVNLFE